jgi:hypothetical protein
MSQLDVLPISFILFCFLNLFQIVCNTSLDAFTANQLIWQVTRHLVAEEMYLYPLMEK